MECPLAPPGSMRRVSGKEGIAAYLDQIRDSLGSNGMKWLSASHAGDAAVSILEHARTASNLHADKHYAREHIAVVQLRAGRIVLFQECWNSLPVMEACG